MVNYNQTELTCDKGYKNFIFHPCEKCDDSLSCDLGNKLRYVGQDSFSLYTKIVEYNYLPTCEELENMTIDQLNEVTRAFDDQAQRQPNFAVDYWDLETQTWKTKKAPLSVEKDSVDYWDNELKMWKTRRKWEV